MNRKGYTLVELLIVMALIGVLFTAVAAVLKSARDANLETQETAKIVTTYTKLDNQEDLCISGSVATSDIISLGIPKSWLDTTGTALTNGYGGPITFNCNNLKIEMVYTTKNIKTCENLSFELYQKGFNVTINGQSTLITTPTIATNECTNNGLDLRIWK